MAFKKEYLKLLGKQVMPIVKRSKYGAANYDRIGNLNYLTGEDRIKYANRVVDEAINEQRGINRTQEWTVWAIKADGTFTLLSDYGYEQDNVNRSDFRLLNHATK
jgi:hypothetical protein